MGVYDVIKDGVTVARNAGNLELSLKLAALADDLMDKQTQINKLEAENTKLKEQLKRKNDFVSEKSVYWLKSDTERKQPYCPNCYANGKEMLMQPDRQNTTQTVFRCPNPDCKHVANPYDYHHTGVANAHRSNRYFDPTERY